jgi:hypothetical protein
MAERRAHQLRLPCILTHPSILCLVVKRNELRSHVLYLFTLSHIHASSALWEMLESSVLLFIYKEPTPHQAKAVPHLACALVNSNPTFALITDGQREGRKVTR